MRWTIGKRVFAALTVISLLIVALNATATRWSFQRGFADYLGQQEAKNLAEVADELSRFYRREGSWANLKSDRRQWDKLFRNQGGPQGPRPRLSGEGGRPPPPRGSPPPPDPLDLRFRVTLVDAANNVVIGRDTRNERVQRIDVVDSNVTIGTLLVVPQAGLTEQVDLNFANQQFRSAVYIGIVVLLLAAGIAAIFAKQLVRPITALTAGTKALTAGAFEKRITVARDDEIGDLAHDFNLLAETLQTNQRLRRQWVSDISHELRTPLAILNGELQAIVDGVRTFDEGTRKSLQAEVDRLSKLVTDLHELTISDEGGLQYTLELIDVVGILRDTLDSFESRSRDANVELRLDVSAPDLHVSGDSARLDQLFTNLLENSIRYTDGPGTIEVRVDGTREQVTICVADSAPGVTDGERERLFDRLYRAEGSRNRASGGSGLGLSISKAIVAAHGGTIVAEPSELGGVAIRITLPRLNLGKGKS